MVKMNLININCAVKENILTEQTEQSNYIKKHITIKNLDIYENLSSRIFMYNNNIIGYIITPFQYNVNIVNNKINKHDNEQKKSFNIALSCRYDTIKCIEDISYNDIEYYNDNCRNYIFYCMTYHFGYFGKTNKVCSTGTFFECLGKSQELLGESKNGNIYMLEENINGRIKEWKLSTDLYKKNVNNIYIYNKLCINDNFKKILELINEWSIIYDVFLHLDENLIILYNKNLSIYTIKQRGYPNEIGIIICKTEVIEYKNNKIRCLNILYSLIDPTIENSERKKIILQILELSKDLDFKMIKGYTMGIINNDVIDNQTFIISKENYKIELNNTNDVGNNINMLIL